MTKQTCAARFLVFDANFTSNVETARMGLSALTPHASPQAGERVITNIQHIWLWAAYSCQVHPQSGSTSSSDDARAIRPFQMFVLGSPSASFGQPFDERTGSNDQKPPCLIAEVFVSFILIVRSAQGYAGSTSRARTHGKWSRIGSV